MTHREEGGASLPQYPGGLLRCKVLDTMRRKKLALRCHAKINLGLSVLGSRPDGYHDLRTILQTVDLHDTLEVTPAERISLEIIPEWAGGRASDLPADGSNLVIRAAESLREPLGGRGASFRLVKRIPAGSGLGGASSDAAGALVALNRLYGLDLAAAGLHRVAASLGSDVPFFLYGGACLALGRGDEVYPLPDGPGLHLVLAFADEGLSTPEVYKEWDRLLTSADNICRMNDFAPWCLVLRGERPGVANDLEEAAIRLRPSLKALRRALEAPDISAVSMTGSGSTFFGLCVNRAAALRGVRRVRGAGYAALAARCLGRNEQLRRLWTAA